MSLLLISSGAELIQRIKMSLLISTISEGSLISMAYVPVKIPFFLTGFHLVSGYQGIGNFQGCKQRNLREF
ncbi:hypothetical protein CLOM621_07030 [Clostridium sp. M62/1]|nr:hypothetical protein CLOM621_07030 [Clostridium sp. M62/1]